MAERLGKCGIKCPECDKYVLYDLDSLRSKNGVSTCRFYCTPCRVWFTGSSSCYSGPWMLKPESLEWEWERFTEDSHGAS